jgi:probable HAF family extracellular repeat protein
MLRAQLFTDLRSTQFIRVPGVASTSHGPVVLGVGEGGDALVTSRWTPAGGKVIIPELQTGPYPFIPEDLSANGTVIVGRGAGTLEPYRPSAYRWTEKDGLQELTPNIHDASFSVRTRVSGDGSTVSGFGASAGFRWRKETGTVSLGAKLDGIEVISPDNPLFFPNAMSWDGSVIAGMNTVSPFQPGEASRWTEETGLVGLGFLFNSGPEEGSVATGITANGSIIVGTGSADETYSEAFRWIEGQGMQSLGVLPGGSSSYAVGISADGGRIFGGSRMGNLPFDNDPFVWTARDGMRRLVEILTERGAGDELAGWNLDDITAFSADGRFVVGRGTGPDGRQGFWMADIGMSPVPEPSTVGLFAATGLLVFVALRGRISKRVPLSV